MQAYIQVILEHVGSIIFLISLVNPIISDQLTSTFPLKRPSYR